MMKRFRVPFPLLWLAAAQLLSLSLAAAQSPSSSSNRWSDYRVIMWMDSGVFDKPVKLPLALQRFREMGVNTGMVYDGGDPLPLVSNRFPYYVENLVNRGLCLKWGSSVKDWEAFVTRWAKTRDQESLHRDYGLNDTNWLDWAGQQVRETVRRNRPFQPLAYDLRDELSVTISANPFDYDFSPVALDGFRTSLRDIYPNLDALNREWETRFASWTDVRPFTTDEIKGRMASGRALPSGQPDWGALPAHPLRSTHRASKPHPLELLALGRFPRLHGSFTGCRPGHAA